MRQSVSRYVAILLLAPLGLLPLPLRGDDVHLKNGHSFEGVIVVEQGGERIRIRLPFGELGLSSNLVDSIVLAPSDLAVYLERRKALIESSGSANDWLQLALWADGRGLDHGYREAALRAAARDPLLDGIEPHLRSLGYALDRKAGLWVPYSRLRRKSAGPGEGRQSSASPEAEAAARQARLGRLQERMLEARLARLEQQSEPPAQPSAAASVSIPILGLYPSLAWTGWSFPPVQSSSPPPPADPTAGPVTTRPADPTMRALLLRQPGSLIPVSTLAR